MDPEVRKLAQLYPDDRLAQARPHACRNMCVGLTVQPEQEPGSCRGGMYNSGGQAPPQSAARSFCSAGSDDSGATSSFVTAHSSLPSPTCHHGEEQHCPSSGNATTQPCWDGVGSLATRQISHLQERLEQLAKQLRAHNGKCMRPETEAQREEHKQLASLWQQKNAAWARVSRLRTEVAELEAYVAHLEADSAIMSRYA